ncbi:AAA family ATPase [Glycomyces buryatensis]|uniref:ATP-binding protein n=1 Tax=Glycomyces buryatensis TaxID=2570927 RepID=A0A4S8QCR0_9ACTN|nr:AAA family ATPase [Glycomyces buryatensis]THV42148.1 ATP-binding protein [Glycomyces buryatensis]
MDNIDAVLETLAQSNRGVLQRKSERAELARKAIWEQFPRSDWPSMSLDRYAQGNALTSGTTFCTLMEFHTDALGSIKGGSAAKHMIYRHHTGEWRLAASLQGLDVELAWQWLRNDFVTAFERIESGDFDSLDGLKYLQAGQSLSTKTFAAYFPEHFAHVYGKDHLHHFIRLLGSEPIRGAASWSLNRQLKSLIDESLVPRLDVSRFEAVEALYAHFAPPRDPHVLKIAPGKGAEWWEFCLEGSVIGVGWNQVGDLTQYASADELRTALDTEVEPKRSNVSLAKKLLQFRDLQPGDLIVANRGTHEVLGLGTVTGGYRFDQVDPELPWNLVEVEWDINCKRRLDQPLHGWQQTFGKVSPDLLHQLRPVKSAETGAIPVAEAELPVEVQRLKQVVDLKGQLILHGPPGTGKTRLALRAALALAGRYPDSEAEVPTAIQNLLDDGTRAMLTTFHPSYGYEDFIEGFKPVPSDEGGLKLELRRGLFLDACDAARAVHPDPYTLVIDEVNRGDLPRVFGELITMLEKDKRPLSMRLPVSGQTFNIPDNLRIIATLNSADHSITSLDNAIRRRFSFVRLDPDPEVLTGSVDGLDLAVLLRELNARIRAHLGADLEIGHAYLLRDDRPIDTAAHLALAFFNELVPLLEDYTFDRPEILERLLGSMLDPQIGSVKTFEPSDLVGALASEFARDGDE